MRQVFIPPGSQPPQAWRAQAAALTTQLVNATDDRQRIKIAFKWRALWRDPGLLNWLSSLHHRKCWYSEARESVSSYHVDHYRPKGRAVQMNGAKRPGYWWLTFEWTNYRLSGQLLNTKKRDWFPVQYPGLAHHTQPGSLPSEGPLLIDPLTSDACHFSFERMDDERCIAQPAPNSTGTIERRVNITIEVFGLNRLPMLNANRADVWDKCMEQIRAFRNAENELILNTRTALEFVAAKSLAALCLEDQEFSSVALACLNKQAPLAMRIMVNNLLQHPDLVRLLGAA